MDALGWLEGAGFLLGLLVGSFLNVCIVRVPRGESVVRPGSHCMACGRAVRWYDNLPVVSWMVLRGRCRDCGDAIAWQYWAVELAVGMWFALAGARMGHALQQPSYALDSWMPVQAIGAVAFAVLGFLLIGLMVIDWQTHRLPDAFTWTGIAAGVFLVCVQSIFLGPQEDQIVLNSSKQLRLRSPGSFAAQGNVFLTGPESLIFGRVAAVVGVALLLLAVRWVYQRVRKREGMGLGDVKLLAMIAAFLGFGQSMVSLLVAAVAASVYGVALMASGKARGATRLPFGSFLAAGGLVAAVFGERVVGWYMGLLR